ncbi:MAG TPA: hypothetical protein VEF89_29810 [Solirubrobacteraceae bacterium]|nr:hypothetical protein [Solirubrobacteraceae bacterium]
MLPQSVHRECVLHCDRAGTVLYGIIVILGGRIWVENRVNFMKPVNLLMAGVPEQALRLP